MKFEFAKYTEITDLAFELRPEWKEEGYIRFFICNDVWDIWFIRVLEGVNEDYDREEGVFLLERNNIGKDSRSQDLNINKVKKIIQEDDGSNWDIKEYYDINKLIDDIADIYGINNLKS